MSNYRDKVEALRRSVNFKRAGQRDGCNTCSFVELRSAAALRGKNFYCRMSEFAVPAHGICDKFVRREK